MAHGCFTDKDDHPDLGRAQTAVSVAVWLWEELTDDLRLRTRTLPEWRFYGRNHGWALAFKNRGRALAALFPDDGRFTVLVVLTGDQADAALADEGMSAPVRELVGSLPRYREGCWVFLPVANEEGVADARRLIEIRAGLAAQAD